MKRQDWILTGIGFVVGFGLALAYAWLLSPVRYVETAPGSLRDSYRQDYLALIAAAYAGTGDLDRAEARLSLFELEDPVDQLTALAQERLAEQGQETTARALARLAADLGAIPLPTSAVRDQTQAAGPAALANTPTAVPTRAPTSAPTVTPAPLPPFELASREQICDPELAGALLQVEVLDAAGEPVPAMEVIVLSDTGEDHFYTGLKPELGLGYGDFEMDPERTYTIQIASGQAPVTGVGSQPCEADGSASYPGSVRLLFREPAG